MLVPNFAIEPWIFISAHIQEPCGSTRSFLLVFHFRNDDVKKHHGVVRDVVSSARLLFLGMFGVAVIGTWGWP
jgi:hypothetical protein